jgi:hypothetical protein
VCIWFSRASGNSDVQFHGCQVGEKRLSRDESESRVPTATLGTRVTFPHLTPIKNWCKVQKEDGSRVPGSLFPFYSNFYWCQVREGDSPQEREWPGLLNKIKSVRNSRIHSTGDFPSQLTAFSAGVFVLFSTIKYCVGALALWLKGFGIFHLTPGFYFGKLEYLKCLHRSFDSCRIVTSKTTTQILTQKRRVSNGAH